MLIYKNFMSGMVLAILDGVGKFLFELTPANAATAAIHHHRQKDSSHGTQGFL